MKLKALILSPWAQIYLLVAFHVFGNVLWLTLNTVPPTWDAALHTVLSIKFLEAATSYGIFHPIEFLRITQYYPPLVHWAGALIAVAGGTHYQTIALTGTLFFAIAILFQYLLSKELFKNHTIGIFSAFFFSFFITVYQQSRLHMLDIPLMALILGAFYFLMRSEGFRKRLFTLLFFLFFAFAFLTKWYAVVYLLIPIIYTIWQVNKNQKITISILTTVGLGLGLFVLASFPWYLVNLEKIIEISRITATPELADPQNLLSLGNLTFILKLIIMFQLSFIGFIFFLYSSVILLRSKSRVVLMIFSIIVFGYLFFSFIPNKNIRYIIPLMPFFAMIMGYGAIHVKRLVLFALAVWFILSYLILSFGFPFSPNYKYTATLPVLGWTDLFYLDHYPVNVLYKNSSFPYVQVLKDIALLKSGQINYLLLKNTEEINNGILDPYLHKELASRKKDFNFIGYDTIPQNPSEDEIRNYLDENIDVVIVSTGYLGLKEAIREYDTAVAFQKFFLSGKASSFTKISEYDFTGDDHSPNDKLLLFYRRTGTN